MANVVLNHVFKVYPNGTKAVNDFNINIKDKEFIVFVGPSGCGKSTTLRMIAGLEEITTGDLYIGDNLVNDVQPKERDIAMVFQNYALYPHMSVYENMAFSLKNQHMPKDEINKRVLEAARILGIEDYLQKKPKEMSGGQRQRVSLGRAIVRNPKVFLLDEPLSNLDAKLRAQMRAEISRLHKKLATTFIYVTHDQVEAMTMGTRIVVMKLGYVQQIDTPINLYNHPINKFVAGFIGTPQMNFFNVNLKRQKDLINIAFEDSQTMSVENKYFVKCDVNYFGGDKTITLGIRPDHIVISEKKTKATLDVVVSSIEKLGNETLLYCDLGNNVLTDESISKSPIIIKVGANVKYEIGDKLHALFKNEFLQLFDNDNEQSIMPYYPTYSVISMQKDEKTITLFNKEVNIFDAFKTLPNKKRIVKIPNISIHEGKTFSLPVFNCEFMEENKYLVTLFDEINNEYLFATSNKEVKVGNSFNFDVSYEDIIIDDDSNIKPVSHIVESVGHFEKAREKDENGKRVIRFCGVVANAKYRLNDEFIRRFSNVEGRRVLQCEYRIRFTPKASLEQSANNIDYEKVEILNYGDKKYLKCLINSKTCDIDISNLDVKDDSKIYLSFNEEKPLEVYTLNTDVKII